MRPVLRHIMNMVLPNADNDNDGNQIMTEVEVSERCRSKNFRFVNNSISQALIFDALRA